jgi:hypothetical protein
LERASRPCERPNNSLDNDKDSHYLLVALFMQKFALLQAKNSGQGPASRAISVTSRLQHAEISVLSLNMPAALLAVSN